MSFNSVEGMEFDLPSQGSYRSPSTVSSVQSPATMAAQMDSAFVGKHNASAECYQIFKDDVDVIYYGHGNAGDQGMLISRILQTCTQLAIVYESEKQYLMGEVLCTWAIRQQKVSIGSAWTQQQHYNQLAIIDTQFEYFGELLEQTLSGLEFLVNSFPKHGFEDCLIKIRHIAHYFLFFSIIVSKQPPSVVVKCGEAENHRRSRFWFSTEIRILGGRAFGLSKAADKTTVVCYLITDETAKAVLANAYHDVTENEEFVIEPQTSVLKQDDVNGHAARFDDMRLSKKGPLRRDGVATKRYCLCYNIAIPAKHDIHLIGKKVSLPFAVLVGPKADVEARLMLERSFADLVRKPLSDIPLAVHYTDMTEALEMKFQSLIEIPQKSTDMIPLRQPRTFTNHTKHHLIHRLKPNESAHIMLDNFLKLPVAEEFVLKRGSTTDGEWKLVPYFEWFFKTAELVNKHFLDLWNDGLIFGFCSKDEAEHLLTEIPRPTMLVRFSDIEFGKIKLSVRDRHGQLRHKWYSAQELAVRSLSKELMGNGSFYGVECIYPDINFAHALGSKTPQPMEPRKPRNLQPTPLYFDNQEAATPSI